MSLNCPDFRGVGAGRAFEDSTLERLSNEEANGHGCFGRYGVQAAVMGRHADGSVHARLIPSLPDFEGVLSPSGRQVVWDNKVVSGPSLNLVNYREATKGSRRRQFRHMIDRADHGAICGFLIHWNSRELKSTSQEASTWWLPVSSRMRIWKEFVCGELRVLTRAQCETHGLEVFWNKGDRERKYRPDVLSVWRELAT